MVVVSDLRTLSNALETKTTQSAINTSVGTYAASPDVATQCDTCGEYQPVAQEDKPSGQAE